MSVENRHMIADDLNTPGMFPKAWVRENGTFFLLKDGDEDAVERELLASRIVSCFDIPQVIYEEDQFDDLPVSRSRIITSMKNSLVTMEAFQIYAANHDIDWFQEVSDRDNHSYYMMNIVDYLIGNTDRHWGNWGWLIDNETGERLRLHELMDFNRAFGSYHSIDGAMCLTVPVGMRMTQREAALEAAEKIEWKPVRPIEDVWFGDRVEWRVMFHRRMEELENSESF